MFRVMTLNLRRDNSESRKRPTRPGQPDHWPDRVPLLRALLRAEAPAILGVQEALPRMLPVVDDALGDDYVRLGRGRAADGKGEACCLYVDRRLFEVLDHGQFALSSTPDVAGSTSWGTTIPRIATWARLTGPEGELLMVNTHLDHKAAKAQRRGAELVAEFAEQSDVPVVVTGDFNVAPGSKPHRILTQHLRDTWTGPARATYHGYQDPPGGERIDWILVSPRLAVVAAEIVDGAEGGRWPSDHAAVRADLEFARG